MDSEHYSCGTCRHGILYDQCSKCEAEYEATRSKPDYERGFIDGMQKQTESSVYKAINKMCERRESEYEATRSAPVQPLDIPRINDLWGQALKYANPTAGDAHIKFARLIEMELKETK